MTPGWAQHVSKELDEPTLPIYADVALHSDGHGSTRGSWSWQNLEEANRATRLLSSALHLYSWARGDASAGQQQQQLPLMLGATDGGEVLASTAGWFVRALLGNMEIRRAFTESMADG